VVPGSAFIAVAGRTTDGHLYRPDAVRNGAVVVYYEGGRSLGVDAALYPDVSFVPTADTRELGCRLAPAFYDFPARRMRVTAITGTNGKSTCSLLLEGISRGLGSETGVVNTFGIQYGGRSLQLANVVPEPVRLQRLLSEMVEAGVEELVIEVSSQALEERRLCGTDLDAAVLTNVTRDHLDVHGTMEQYLEAKLSMFELLSRSTKPRRSVSLWRDCWSFPSIAERLAGRGLEPCVYWIGPEEGTGTTQLCADDLSFDPAGTSFSLHWQGGRIGCRTSLLGRFNVLNILAALGSRPEFLESVFVGDKSSQAVLDRVLVETRVPGRLEAVPNSLGAAILVDYAHTDDGLTQVLTTLRALPHRRLYTLFGCGGDRDRGKRPKMGAAAGRLSDSVILTSDNPRTEEPRAIIRDIEEGIRGLCPYAVIEDRARAIADTIDLLQEGDILLVAGKGHETTQVVGVEALPFSDVDVVRQHLSARGWVAP
jgi:UDP-N-acetylmuramoyl-L-alanyl-D-glutamate--2,6-diaminopimelate ligase